MANILLFCLITGAVVITGFIGLRFIRNLTSRPVPEIHLSPIAEPKWTVSKKITDLIDSFQQKGFESAGNYQSPEIPLLVISGYVHTSEQMAGAIYDHPFHGI